MAKTSLAFRPNGRSLRTELSMIAATQSNHPLGQVTKPGEAPATLDLVRTRLRASHMRVTQPRISILRNLINRTAPASIEQIHREIAGNSCDLVTVYRCLAAFEQIGLVRRSFLHNGTALYEFTLGEERHYHIICKECGQAERVGYFSVEGPKRVLRERGYADLSHLVEFFGICPACRKAAPARASAPSATKTRG